MFGKPVVGRQSTPHFDRGRAGWPVVGICFHIAAGNRDAVVNWFADPASKVSSHFLIGRDGGIDQFVDEADTAWTQGIVNQPTWPLLQQYPLPNRALIGIEHEGTPEQEWTEAEYQADLALCLYLCQAYGIRPERPFLLGHCDLDGVDRPDCPGPHFPWDRLLDDLQAQLPQALPDWLPPLLAAAQAAGLSDGSRPLAPATRAEALTLMMRAVGAALPAAPAVALPAAMGLPPWLQPHLAAALHFGISDGSRLSEGARRGEVMAMAVRALAAVPAAAVGAAVAAAAYPGAGRAWSPLHVAALAQQLGLSDGARPGEVATRGEVIAMALRLWRKLQPE